MAASVWKRLQRVNKKAAKFQYTASYQRIDFEITTKWKPHKLSVAWTRRSRRVTTEALEWDPSLKDPLKGTVIWPVPENHTVAVTLFKDSRTNELEDKDWIFILEDVSATGKRRKLAFANMNMCKYASLEPTQKNIHVQLIPNTSKIVSASITLTLSCVLLREGRATDEDMQSLASLFSVNNNSDIAPLEDLDDEDFSFSDHSAKQVMDLTQQMQLLTNSLTLNDLADTPLSVQSLKFDNSDNSLTPTPMAEKKEIIDKHIIDKKDDRTEFLRDLTRMSMRSENYLKDKQKKENIEAAVESKETVDNKLSDGTTFKTISFKPKHLSKHSLKPLQFKNNLNNMDPNEKVAESKIADTKITDTKITDTEITDTKITDTVQSDKIGPNGDVTPDICEDDDKTPVVTEINSSLLVRKGESRDKTPVHDLLEWCTEVTGNYSECRVTNLTTSWRDGLAFCAVIHHYRPDLIDFASLSREEPEKNLRKAFEASSKLGISQVLTAADISNKKIPDKLAIMTHLFQLRAHFTGGELRVEQLGSDNQESSYMIGRHDTDTSIPRELFSMEIASARARTKMKQSFVDMRTSLSSQESEDSQNSQERALTPKDKSPTSIKEVKGLFLDKSKSILDKMLSPNKDKHERRDSGSKMDSGNKNEPVPSKPAVLMTRKQLTDPFGSDDEDDSCQTANDKSAAQNPSVTTESSQTNAQNKENISSVTDNLPKPPPQLLSRHDELKEKARQLLEQQKKDVRWRRDSEDSIRNGDFRNGDLSPKKMSEEERQRELKERAKRLIAGARAGIVSPKSPTRFNKPCTVEIISRESMMDEIEAAGGIDNINEMFGRRDSKESNHSSKSSSQNSDLSETSVDNCHVPESIAAMATSSPKHSLEILSNGKQDYSLQDENDDMTYIQSEMAALEREQAIIDEEAAILEGELRNVMESSNSNEEEDRLMTKWFNLVNKKNALLRRQMQLNILEQEQDLTQKCALLERELRQSLAVEDWKKSKEQCRRERLLLNELLEAVNNRDRLVHEMDEQEKAIEADDEIERDLSNVEIQRKNNCILQ